MIGLRCAPAVRQVGVRGPVASATFGLGAGVGGAQRHDLGVVLAVDVIG